MNNKLTIIRDNKFKIGQGDLINIPIVFYYNSSENEITKLIEKEFNPILIDTVECLIEMYSFFNFFNFIKIDELSEDFIKIKEDILGLRKNLFYKKQNIHTGSFNEEEYSNFIFNNFNLYFFLISENIFQNKIINNLFIINVNGNLLIIDSKKKQKFEDELKINNFTDNQIYTIKEEYIYLKEHNKEKNISGYDTLNRFISFLLKNGIILFLSKIEDFDYNETYYNRLKDNKKIIFIEDLKAIIRYSIITYNLNLYHDFSLWSEHLLYKSSEGISVVDNNFTLLYANERRRKRHKNNILGKKCYEVFNCINSKNNCTLLSLFNSSDEITSDRKEIKISDKAQNEYYILENNTIAYLRAYKQKIGITSCKDVNFRHSIIELSKNIQKQTDKKEILNDIKKTFIDLGFNWIRIYENYSPSIIERENDSIRIEPINNNPKLVLVSKTNNNTLNIGYIIRMNLLNERSFINIYSKEQAFSLIELFIDNREKNKLTLFDIKKIIEGKIKKRLINDVKLKDKWIDIPLWIGNRLIGVISINFDIEYNKWRLIDEDLKFQLFHASIFLASSIQNSNLNRINENFKDLTNKLANTTLSVEPDKQIEIDIFRLFFKYINNPESIIIFYYSKKNNHFKLTMSLNESNNCKIELTKSYQKSSDVLLSDDCGKHLILPENIRKYSDVKDLCNNKYIRDINDINSLIDIYYNSNERNLGILRIVKIGKNIVPLSQYDYTFLRMSCKQISELLYSYSFKNKYFTIINAFSKPITESTAADKTSNVENNIKLFISNLFNEINTIYPDTIVTIFQNLKNELRFINSSNFSKKDFNKQKEIEKDFFYELPPPYIKSDELKYKWVILNRKGFTPSLLYSEGFQFYYRNRNELNKAIVKAYNEDDQVTKCLETKFDKYFPELKEYQSEIINKIVFNGEVIGIIRFQDIEEDTYRKDFKEFVEKISFLLGNTLGLLQNIKRKEEYEESLTHELRSPILTATNIIDWEIKKGMKMNFLEFIKLNNNSSTIEVNKFALFKNLFLLNISIQSIFLFVRNINLDVITKEDFTYKELNLSELLYTVVNLAKYQKEKSKKGLSIEWGSFNYVNIIGDEKLLQLAFFNLVNNAIKYSLKINKKFYPIEISSFYNSITKRLVVKVANYGETIRSEELNYIFDRKYRGSNAINNKINGLGLGLGFSKKIFEMHEATINFTIPVENKTEVIVEFNIEKNKKITNAL